MSEMETLLTGSNAMLASLVFAICVTLKQALRGAFSTNLGQRFLPILPLLLGTLLSFMGLGSAQGWRNQLVVGILSGFVAAHIYKIGKDTVLGHNLSTEDLDPSIPSSSTNSSGGAA